MIDHDKIIISIINPTFKQRDYRVFVNNEKQYPFIYFHDLKVNRNSTLKVYHNVLQSDPLAINHYDELD